MEMFHHVKTVACPTTLPSKAKRAKKNYVERHKYCSSVVNRQKTITVIDWMYGEVMKYYI